MQICTSHRLIGLYASLVCLFTTLQKNASYVHIPFFDSAVVAVFIVLVVAYSAYLMNYSYNIHAYSDMFNVLSFETFYELSCSQNFNKTSTNSILTTKRAICSAKIRSKQDRRMIVFI